MCGRFSRDMTWAQVRAFSQGLDLIVPDADPVPNWNIAPTQASWVIAAQATGGGAEEMRWGLVPSWARDRRTAASMINARLESVATKPAFRSAFKMRRCLVPASGYYEWRLENGIKQPYWIHHTRHPVLMFAGLWESWKSPAGDRLQSFAIITCAAVDAMQQLHDRTPVMLDAPVLCDWLHGSPEAASDIAHAARVPALAWHPVDRAVGNPRSNGPRLIEPLSARPEADPSLFGSDDGGPPLR